MHAYRCHGTYLHDFDRCGSLQRGRELTTDEAVALLDASPFVRSASLARSG